MMYSLLSPGIYRFTPKPQHLKNLGKNLPDDFHFMILDLRHIQKPNQISVSHIVSAVPFEKLYINLNGKDFLLYFFGKEALIGRLNLFDSETDIFKSIQQQIPFDINGNILKLYGTLRGETMAENMGKLLYKEESSIFLDLNYCYCWDKYHAKQLRNVRSSKMVYLIKKESLTNETLFHLRGEIFYESLEKAYKDLELSEKKQYTIIPKYERYLFSDSDKEKDILALGQIPQTIKQLFIENKNVNISNHIEKLYSDNKYSQQWYIYDENNEKYIIVSEGKTLNIYECNILEMRGYIANEKSIVESLIKEFYENLGHKKKICLDIRNLHYLSIKATLAILQILKTKKKQNADFSAVIVTTLPRNDNFTREINNEYVILNVINDLYCHGIPVISSIEEAQDVFSTLKRPKLTIKNTMMYSILEISGNIILAEDVLIFKQEVHNLVRNAFSGFPTDPNSETKQKIIFFDFQKLPCPPISVLNFIVNDVNLNQSQLIKIILGNDNLEEIFKLLYPQKKVLCYRNKQEALQKHLCKILILSEHHFWGQNSSDLIQHINKEIQRDDLKIQITKCYNLDYIGIYLQDQHDLVILDIKNMKNSVHSLCERYRKAGNKVLEVKQHNQDYIELASHQIESDCDLFFQKQKIYNMIENQDIQSYRIILAKKYLESIYSKYLLSYIEKEQLLLVDQIYGGEGEADKYEINIFPNKERPNKILFYERGMQKEKSIVFFPFLDIFEFLYETNNPDNTSLFFSLLINYAGLPMKIKCSPGYKYNQFLTIKNALAFSSFELPDRSIDKSFFFAKASTLSSQEYQVFHNKIYVELTEKVSQSFHSLLKIWDFIFRFFQKNLFDEQKWVSMQIDFRSKCVYIFHANQISILILFNLLQCLEDSITSGITPMTNYRFSLSDFGSEASEQQDNCTNFLHNMYRQKDDISIFFRNSIGKHVEPKNIVHIIHRVLLDKPLPLNQKIEEELKDKLFLEDVRLIKQTHQKYFFYTNRLILETTFPHNIKSLPSLLQNNMLKIGVKLHG